MLEKQSDRGTQREREREEILLFHMLVYSPNVCNSWGWSRLKPGARSSMKSFHKASSDPRI